MTPVELKAVTGRLKYRALMRRAELRYCFYLDVKALVNHPDFIDNGEARISVESYNRYQYKNFSKSIHLSQSDYWLKAKVRL